MTKISKTAAASMKGEPAKEKVDPFNTNAKKIRELQIQRQNHLSVSRYDFIDALLEEHGKLQESFARLESERDKLKGDVAFALADRDTLAARVKELEPLEYKQAPLPSLSEQLQADLEPLP